MAEEFSNMYAANAGFQQTDAFSVGQASYQNVGTNGKDHGGDKSDEDSRKLFVGGIHPEATKDEVQEYFSQFGEVEMCTIKTDVYSGRSRGFGFLIFKDVNSVDGVLAQGVNHEIRNKRIDPKLATPQAGKTGEPQNPKVFVGGVDKHVSKEAIKASFSQRGKVTDVYLPMDLATNEGKGYAFVTFEDASIAAELCTAGKFNIEGKDCDVRKAQNKNTDRGGAGRGGFGGGRGNFGGGFNRGGGNGGFRGGRGGGRGGRGGFDNSYGGGSYNYGGDNSGYNYSTGGNFAGNYGSGYNYGGATYDQNSQYSGGYDQNAGYGNYGGAAAAAGGGGGSGYDQNWAANQTGYQQDQGGYKMKREGRGGYHPY